MDFQEFLETYDVKVLVERTGGPYIIPIPFPGDPSYRQSNIAFGGKIFEIQTTSKDLALKIVQLDEIAKHKLARAFANVCFSTGFEVLEGASGRSLLVTKVEIVGSRYVTDRVLFHVS